MDNSLVTVEQKTIDFYDDELIAIRADDGQVYVSLRHLCTSIGVDRPSQMRRIRKHHVLSSGYAGGVIMTPPDPQRGGGGQQKAGFLRVDLVPLWLSGIDTKRVKDNVREKLEKYQVEVGKVLWEAFQDGRLTTTFDDLLKNDTPAVNAYKMALAIVEIARGQVIIESRLDDHQNRLEQIEATLGDSGRHITPDQAMQISQSVKAVAIELGRQTKRNEFGAVYGELYRRYSVTSYKEVATHQYEAVMAWLTEWHQSLVSDTEF